MTILRTYHHSDHTLTWLSTSLGSSTSTRLSNLWVTDNTGRPIQHLHYLPFGEDWVDQRNSSWNAPYTFSGKEKDTETGYHYFGARYYDSDLSTWLSVDPMSDKYPSMSPYNYCANNPVKLIDPNGMEIDEASGPKDPPNLLHPNRDTFFDPKDDNQRNTQSSSQSGSKTTNNKNQSSSTNNSNTSSSSSNSNSQNSSQSDNNQANQSPAHSVTIGGVLAGCIGLSLDVGPIWDKDGGGLLICFGFCGGVDASGGVSYSNYKSMESAQGSGEAVVGSIWFADGGVMPDVGWTGGFSLSPLPAGVTVRKTYSIILKPDPAGYGDYISKFGHPLR